MSISFTLTKLISLLLYPLSLCLLLGAVGLIVLGLGRRRAGIGLVAASLLWLYVCSTAVFADFLLARLEQGYPAKAIAVVEKADVIVLLGGGVRGHTHMGRLSDLNQHADRLLHAAELYKAGKAPYILLTGGAAPGDRPEAEQMKDILRIMGVPSSVMVTETASRTTYDNAVFSAAIIAARKWRRVLLVTSAFHMRRAEAAFRAQGVAVMPASTDYKRLVAKSPLPRWLPGVGNLARSSLALHEIAGYWVYHWQGRFKAAPPVAMSGDGAGNADNADK